jgi:hypothetical protein
MKDTGRLQDIDYSLKTAVKCGRRIGNMQHHPAASPPQFLGNDHPIEHFCHRLSIKEFPHCTWIYPPFYLHFLPVQEPVSPDR